jgi:hypothetical protein
VKSKGSEEAEPSWRKDMISARQLCDMRFAPLKFIVPKIIPEGLTILAGRPKIGKSWLVLLVGIVLANGVRALGLDYGLSVPLRGSVLYLGLEDGKRRLQRRMTKLLGAQSENWPEQLYLKTEWLRFDQGGLEDIRAWYESAKAKGETPILVIVDTLAKVRGTGNPRLSPYQNDHDALAGLQKLADELGIAVLVYHHDRKMDAEDVFDTVSGTLGLTGAVDTILVLTRKAQGTSLHIRGRDIEDETALAMQFDKDTGRWSVLGNASEVQRSDERTRIIKVLTAAPDGLSVTEIMAGAELRNRNAADILLFKLAEAGVIERVKRGLYGLPGTLERIKENVRATVKKGKKERSGQNPSDAQEGSNLSANVSDGKEGKDCEESNLSNLSDLSEADFNGKIDKPRDTQEISAPSFHLSDLSTPADADSISAPLAACEHCQESGGNGRIVANGFAISMNPEDRHEPEPGPVFARVWVKEIVDVPLGPPGDDMRDFKPL